MIPNHDRGTENLDRMHAALDGLTLEQQQTVRLMMLGSLSVQIDDQIWSETLRSVLALERGTRRT